MKRLYDDKDKYTKDANDLLMEINGALAPVFKKWSDLGFSIRDIAHVAQGTVFELECCLSMGERKQGK